MRIRARDAIVRGPVTHAGEHSQNKRAMKKTQVRLLGAIAALCISIPQVVAAPQHAQFIIKAARHDACRGTLRLDIANLPGLSPTVLLGAYPTPLSLVASSADYLEVSLPSSIPAGSYRLTVVVGNSPHEYDEAWVMVNPGACAR